MEKHEKLNLNKMTEEEKEQSKTRYIGEVKVVLDDMNSVDNALCFVENGSDLNDDDAGGVYIKAYASPDWMAMVIHRFIQEHPAVGKSLAVMMLREQVQDALENGDIEEALRLTGKATRMMASEKKPKAEVH